jgi:hypothetical protein
MNLWLRGALISLTLLNGGNAAADIQPEETVSVWHADLDAFLEVLGSEHKNPYFLTPEATFDAAVSAYRRALPELSREERIAGLARIVGMVGDGHTWMPMHRLPFPNIPVGPGFRSLPLRFELFDDGLFIVGGTPEYRPYLGAQVEQIGGINAATAVARVLELLPQDAINFSRELVAEWLMQAELLVALELAERATEVVITAAGENIAVSPLGQDAMYDWIFSMDGGPGDLEWLTASRSTPLWQEKFSGLWRTVELPDAVYLQINQIRDSAELSYADMADAAVVAAMALEQPALVIDLRRCLGGDGTLNQGLIAALSRSENRLHERIAVLTSRATHSAAVMLVSDLEQQTSARFYGQGTADRPNHHGETNIFVTPNSKLPIIHASEYYQTSTPDDDSLFRKPDVPVAYLSSDYINGEDPVLARALTDLGRQN